MNQVADIVPKFLCKTQFTMAEVLAFLYKKYVIDKAPWGMAADGTALYSIANQTGDMISQGCAVYEIAREFNPTFVAELDKIPSHAACPASDLSGRGITVASVIAPCENPDFSPEDFLTACQYVHDSQARSEIMEDENPDSVRACFGMNLADLAENAMQYEEYQTLIKKYDQPSETSKEI